MAELIDLTLDELQNMLDASVAHKKPHLFLQFYANEISFSDWCDGIYSVEAQSRPMNSEDLQTGYSILKKLRNGN